MWIDPPSGYKKGPRATLGNHLQSCTTSANIFLQGPVRMSAYQVGCRHARYHRLLRWFTYPPLGTVFSPADVLNNNLLLSICAFLNSNWNLWGGQETRLICRIGDLILDAYVQPEDVIDLTTNEDEPQLPQIWLGEWVVLDEIDGSIDLEDLPGSEEEDLSAQSKDDGPDMLLDNLAQAQESESDYDSHSGSDYSTSESDDSGIDY